MRSECKCIDWRKLSGIDVGVRNVPTNCERSSRLCLPRGSGTRRGVLVEFSRLIENQSSTIHPRLVCQREDIIKRNHAETILTRSAPSITVVRCRRCYTRRRVIIYINININKYIYILYSCVIRRNENARRRE